MLRLIQVEEIDRLLLALPELVRLQERRSTEFPARASAWLGSVEEILSANRLYQAGLIAGIRSSLALADQGQIPAGLEYRGRPTRTRVMASAASDALQRAAQIVAGVAAENRPRFVEAERVAQQVVAALRSHGLPHRPEEMSNEVYLRTLRRTMSQNADLENVLVHLEGIVGPQDALVLLDRAIAASEPPAEMRQKATRRAALRGERSLLAGGRRS
jgi:hypothetical protein